MNRLKKIALELNKQEIKVLEGDSLKVVDNRTGKTYELTLKETKDAFFVNSKDFAKVKAEDK